ncbi:DNA repair protein RecO [Denitrovibrio acetiphilus DSM 12809]|uniref:DNA repair protein RecO n=1 Tax=Denitrovibrio acetiphilus (strain DSM 12809 / NBRC 114555 / N2460) TaxID=522772 RepID=D4H8E3_DENA2|nr:DNA repair protein RecO C-terminal domain-containing protein [Denitrovibrio acetiphilus]ADD68292.1 DNA repair protein RecO [Denitrovibrio acetiphilus DSM 12809]
MSREKTEAIIYKLVRYADSSAIAFAFTEDFGRLKLFVQKAFTKKGGIMCFMPGMLDFGKKDTDLSKYYSFENNTAYYHYLNNHEIVMRMHLIFEIIEGLYEPELPDKKLFDLLLKYDDENFRKITPYIIYFILKRSGVMFQLDSCYNCGSKDDVYCVTSHGLCCPVCSEQLGSASYCDRESAYIIKCMGNSSLYRNVTVNRKQELQVLKGLSEYSAMVIEKPLKSLKTVLEII